MGHILLPLQSAGALGSSLSSSCMDAAGGGAKAATHVAMGLVYGLHVYWGEGGVSLSLSTQAEGGNSAWRSRSLDAEAATRFGNTHEPKRRDASGCLKSTLTQNDVHVRDASCSAPFIDLHRPENDKRKVSCD